MTLLRNIYLSKIGPIPAPAPAKLCLFKILGDTFRHCQIPLPLRDILKHFLFTRLTYVVSLIHFYLTLIMLTTTGHLL